jgi:hypothetical protein
MSEDFPAALVDWIITAKGSLSLREIPHELIGFFPNNAAPGKIR